MRKLSDFTVIFLFILSALLTTSAFAADKAPWGVATNGHYDYKPQKVVYDVNLRTEKAVSGVLDRASFLSKITGADPFESSIVLVLHGAEIPFFAIKNYDKYKDLMHRVQSLVESDVLKIKMCQLAAQGQGFSPAQIHGFVQMVPMGDAEIIRLQNEEQHAYMQ
ncbi:MAG: DsrE family protein [Gammaproteobacteria bacterium]|nr:DsrE family protein [Gammaproteobacteria bacterium]